MVEYKQKNGIPRSVYINLSHQTKLYDLWIKCKSVLDKHGIVYWALAGTSLGVERHGGIVPWDDDIDIGIWVKDFFLLKEKLESEGFSIDITIVSYHITHPSFSTKVFIDLFTLDSIPANRVDRTIISGDGNNNCSDHVIGYSRYYTSKVFPKEYFVNLEEIHPIQERKFGPTTISVASGNLPYLYRVFGKDCLTDCVSSHIHSGEDSHLFSLLYRVNPLISCRFKLLTTKNE